MRGLLHNRVHFGAVTYIPLLAGVCLILTLSGCGGEKMTQPSSAAIPEQLYVTTLGSNTNDCGAGTVRNFILVILPLQDGSSVAGLVSAPTAASRTGDLLNLSTTFQLQTGGAVTVEANWTFAADRETFTGTTSLHRAAPGLAPCTFSFVTVGSHLPAYDAPPPVPTEPAGAAHHASVTGASKLNGIEEAVQFRDPNWGVPGDIRVDSPAFVQCWSQTSTQQRTIQSPGTSVTDYQPQLNGGGDAPDAGSVQAGHLDYVITTTYLLRYDENLAQWGVVDSYAFNPPNQRDVAPPDRDWGTMQLLPYVFYPIDGVIFRPRAPGYYHVMSKYDWYSQQNVAFASGTAWLAFHEASDYQSPDGTASVGAGFYCHVD
jgi:hypothetical protein